MMIRLIGLIRKFTDLELYTHQACKKVKRKLMQRYKSDVNGKYVYVTFKKVFSNLTFFTLFQNSSSVFESVKKA
jgi:hypothetical protein